MQRKQFTTTIREDDLKKIEILAIEKDRGVNDMLEKAIGIRTGSHERQAEEG